MHFSRIWLRVNTEDNHQGEDIIAEFKCDTKDFLESCLNRPADFLLSNPDGTGRSVVRMMARYVPVSIALQPRESTNSESFYKIVVHG